MDDRIEQARRIIRQEADVVRAVADRVDARFADVVSRVLALKGRVVTAGMGKAGIIAEKISATLASTGTPAIFLHPAEAIHGDLGRVMAGDLLLALSKSGETEEVLRLMAPVKAANVPVVAITQDAGSALGRHSDVVLELGPIEEVGPHALAPSASTTAMLALGDALALVVQDGRDFGPEEFARFHPGGDLGPAAHASRRTHAHRRPQSGRGDRLDGTRRDHNHDAHPGSARSHQRGERHGCTRGLFH